MIYLLYFAFTPIYKSSSKLFDLETEKLNLNYICA